MMTERINYLFGKEKGKISYSSGEGYWFLGKAYILKVLIGRGKNVRLTFDGYLNVTVPEYSQSAIKKIIEECYRAQATYLFTKYTNECLPLFSQYIIPMPEVLVRRMKRTWANCCPALGRVTYNLKLMNHDPYAIKAVVVHELCHFIYQRHTKHFYQLLTKVLPDWQEREKRLYANYYFYKL